MTERLSSGVSQPLSWCFPISLLSSRFYPQNLVGLPRVPLLPCDQNRGARESKGLCLSSWWIAFIFKSDSVKGASSSRVMKIDQKEQIPEALGVPPICPHLCSPKPHRDSTGTPLQKAAACDIVTAQSVRGLVSPARREEAGSKMCTQRSVLA